MAKAKARARPKAKTRAKKPQKLGLLKTAQKAASRVVKALKQRPKGKPAAYASDKPAAKGEAKVEAKREQAKKAPAAAGVAAAPKKDPTFLGPLPDKPMPRSTKLPPVGETLNRRDMELVLTAGAGRGVVGEGSLKGRLVVRDAFPYLHVIGRDKRELWFLLQGPDQEVLPAYVDHKVSVSGLIKKTTNYGGTVDVRKYSAKRPDEVPMEQQPVEEKLKFLSPGEVEQLCAAGMGAGMKGYASLRGNLEMTGDDFFLVVSNAGTRQQVSFILEGKGAKGLKKHVGQPVVAHGVVDKASGWGGSISVEGFEPKPAEHKAVGREGMEIAHVEAHGERAEAEVKVNQGLTVRLQERAGYTWAIEPTMAKRVGLREANFEPSSSGPHTREFFFTPRNPGVFEVEFFLAKAFAPAQVSKTFKLQLTVRP